MRRALRTRQGRPGSGWPGGPLTLVALGLLVVVASLGCGGRAPVSQDSHPTADRLASSAAAVSHPASASGSSSAVGPADPLAVNAPPTSGHLAVALSSGRVPTVEELLEAGLHRAGASPTHLAIRGTPATSSVRCAWRGIARTVDQRNAAVRFWLGLGPTDAIPEAAYLEVLFEAVWDTLDPKYRETATANFLAIARGGLSEDYRFLTCFADYAVTHYLHGGDHDRQ